MFIWTIKAHKIRFLLAMTIAVSAIALTALLFPGTVHDYVYPEEALPTVLTVPQKDFRGISDNEARIAFLARYGWEVEAEPEEIREVTVPEKFDAVYESYNQMQLSEGLDLKKVAGKQIKRYTYVVTNAEYDGTVYANLLIYKDKVVGGDVCSARLDGFVHGLSRENDFLTPDPL